MVYSGLCWSTNSSVVCDPSLQPLLALWFLAISVRRHLCKGVQDMRDGVQWFVLELRRPMQEVAVVVVLVLHSCRKCGSTVRRLLALWIFRVSCSLRQFF